MTTSVEAASRFEGAVWIINPIAGVSRGSAYEEQLRAEIPTAAIHLTTRPGEAEELARDAVRAGAHTVVVVGGDGTLAEVGNGVLDTDETGDVAVGFVPAGTCNDFARGREVCGSALDLLDPARARRIDVGRVTFEGRDGPSSRWFLGSSTVGLVSAMAQSFTAKSRVKALVKRASTTLAQVIYGAGAFARWSPVEMRLRIDSEEVVEDATNLAVLKVPYFAGGRTFGSSRIAPDDGTFDVVLVGALSRPRIVLMLWRAFRGQLAGHPSVRVWTGRAVTVDAGRAIPVEVDGEIAGTTPAEFRILPRRLLTIT